jgi:FPC/CPF motif-containing protein YcgG
MKKLTDEGIKYLIKRFGENESEIAKAVSVFDTFTWPEDLEGFGKEDIKIFGKHLSKYFDNNEETVSINLMKEWYEFEVVGEAFKNTRPS